MLLSWNPRIFAFYTGLPSSLYPQTTEGFGNKTPTAEHMLLLRYRHPLDSEKLEPFLRSKPLPPVIFSNPDFAVYHLR